MRFLLPSVVMLLALPVHAEVTASSPSMLEVKEIETIAATPEAIFRDLGHPERWWSPNHTFSGDAKHLSLQIRTDGLFSENWRNGGVVHGRVIHWEREKLLVLDAALGPMQTLAAKGVLTFALEPAGKGTKLTVTYRVSGDPSASLDKLAKVVDAVIDEQVLRLKELAETGKTPAANTNDLPPPPSSADGGTQP